MLALAHSVLGGLNFQINIRGIAVVATAVAILMGSVWLVLATNVGGRLSTLLSLSAFFGWMIIMGIMWWTFGIGYVGDAPTWRAVDINRGDLTVAGVEKARSLPNQPLKAGSPYDLVVNSDSDEAKKEYASAIPGDQLKGLKPDAIAAKKADWELRNLIVTLSEVMAIDKTVIQEAVEAGALDLGGWRLVPSSQAGEANTSATEALVAAGVFTSADQFKVLSTFDVGGKKRLPDDPNRGDRIWRYVRNSATLLHPTRYAVVQVQPVKVKTSGPGEAPPRVESDTGQDVISVILERNLGNKRFKPAMVTIGSLFLFIATTYVLHVRDKQSMANRAAHAAAKK